MFETFDQPDATASCGRRDSSTVAPQALALMNGEFIVAQSAKLAALLRRENGASPQAWVETGSKRVLGRAPSRAEMERALSFLKRNTLESLCLAWFNTSEFLYVD